MYIDIIVNKQAKVKKIAHFNCIVVIYSRLLPRRTGVRILQQFIIFTPKLDIYPEIITLYILNIKTPPHPNPPPKADRSPAGIGEGVNKDT